VLDDLRRRLDAGAFVTGFPTDAALMRDYGVSRHTAREAVRRLQAEGVVRRYRGRGTFVETPQVEQVVGPLYSLFRSVEEQGFEQRSRVLALEMVRDEHAATQLGVPTDGDLLHLRRVRYVGKSPLAVDNVWLPGDRCRALLAVDFTRTGLYHELERLCGVTPVSGWERLRPVLPDREQCRLLGITARQPVFLIERRSDCRDGPLEWRCTVVRGDQYSFVTRWSGSTRADARLQSAPG
jgi:GntR family transcriptional regulator